MTAKYLTALPVYNEVRHVSAVLDEVLRYSPNVLVVDDGSTDGTTELLASRPDVQVLRHERNQGYGGALKSAFEYTLAHEYDVLVTIDCDGQHQPRRIPQFVAAAGDADIVSGSRYLEHFAGDSLPPEQRRRINIEITAELNRRLGLKLTDAFCGFKAYRGSALAHLHVTELGYAMPIEVWAQAVAAGLKIVELPVPLIYLEESRSFGGALDDAETRLAYYRQLLERSLAASAVPRPKPAQKCCGQNPRQELLWREVRMKLTCPDVDRRHTRAPREDGGVLIEPCLHAAGELIERNAALAAGWDYDLCGRSLAALSAEAREELVRAAWEYTRSYRDVSQPEAVPGTKILLAGHQPQLFHPGVWFKNFVLSALAGRHGAVAVNLAIDSDTIKTASLKVPGGVPDAPVLETVPLDRPTDEIPFEERTIVDRGCLAGFASRARNAIERLVPNPLVEQFWPLVIARSRETDKLGECLAQARHQQEGAWGASTLELPQSRICGLPAFHWFTCHLLARLPQLREAYNRSVADYRQANHVRSQSHPVPDLAADQEWLEAPFWIWTSDQPRRRRLFARQSGAEILLTDRRGLELRLPLNCDGDAARAVEQLAALASRGIKLRTRALLTTMFARLVLGDLFLHGIGGAKYDQVTDAIITRFFGFEPPCYMTVTATLRLPIDRAPVGLDDARRIDQRLRELTFHPEHHLPAEADGNVSRLMHEKEHWIATPPTQENARRRCHEIRQANAALQPWLEGERRQLQTEREAALRAARAEKILASREYAFCLYPEDKVRALVEKPFEELGL